MTPSRLAIGLMSGTSMDGIDAALVDVEGRGEAMVPRVLAFDCLPFPRDLPDRLARAHEMTTPELSRLHWDVGHAFARAAEDLLAGSGVDPARVAVVGSHGQTVHHEPPRATLQIGEPSVIRERTGIPTVADFRTADLAAGGEGAPLVPWIDWLLYRRPGRIRLAQNVGGIGNVTRVAHAKAEVFAFDTGPGNMLIDRMAKLVSGGELRFDPDGRLAGGGRPAREIVDGWMTHEFFARRPPRSTGRELFGEPFLERVAADTAGLADADRMATTTWLTAVSIARAYADFVGPYDEVILSGGGARNRTLVGYLTELLRPVPVVTSDAYGLSVDAKEAVAFALLALATLDGVPANLPRATGARREVVLGKVMP